MTTRSGLPVDQRNVGRAFHKARTAAGVDHGSLKTFRSTVATQLAEAGLLGDVEPILIVRTELQIHETLPQPTARA